MHQTGHAPDQTKKPVPSPETCSRSSDANTDSKDLSTSSASDEEDSSWVPYRRQLLAKGKNKRFATTRNQSYCHSKPALPAQTAAERRRTAESPSPSIIDITEDESEQVEQDAVARDGVEMLEAQQGPPDGLLYPCLPQRTYFKGFKKVRRISRIPAGTHLVISYCAMRSCIWHDQCSMFFQIWLTLVSCWSHVDCSDRTRRRWSTITVQRPKSSECRILHGDL